MKIRNNQSVPPPVSSFEDATRLRINPNLVFTALCEPLKPRIPSIVEHFAVLPRPHPQMINYRPRFFRICSKAVNNENAG